MRGRERDRGCEQRCWFKLIPLCLDLVGAPIKRIIIVATIITFCKNTLPIRSNRKILDRSYSLPLENDYLSLRNIRFYFFLNIFTFFKNLPYLLLCGHFIEKR